MSFPARSKVFSRHAKDKVPMLKKLRGDVGRITIGELEKLVKKLSELKVAPMKSGKLKLLMLDPSVKMISDLSQDGWECVDMPYPNVYQFER